MWRRRGEDEGGGKDAGHSLERPAVSGVGCEACRFSRAECSCLDRRPLGPRRESGSTCRWYPALCRSAWRLGDAPVRPSPSCESVGVRPDWASLSASAWRLSAGESTVSGTLCELTCALACGIWPRHMLPSKWKSESLGYNPIRFNSAANRESSRRSSRRGSTANQRTAGSLVSTARCSRSSASSRSPSARRTYATCS